MSCKAAERQRQHRRLVQVLRQRPPQHQRQLQLRHNGRCNSNNNCNTNSNCYWYCQAYAYAADRTDTKASSHSAASAVIFADR